MLMMVVGSTSYISISLSLWPLEATYWWMMALFCMKESDRASSSRLEVVEVGLTGEDWRLSLRLPVRATLGMWWWLDMRDSLWPETLL